MLVVPEPYFEQWLGPKLQEPAIELLGNKVKPNNNIVPSEHGAATMKRRRGGANFAYDESPRPKRAYWRLARESEGSVLRRRKRQNFFMLSGSFPWPVVEHTKTIILSFTSCSCNIQGKGS